MHLEKSHLEDDIFRFRRVRGGREICICIKMLVAAEPRSRRLRLDFHTYALKGLDDCKRLTVLKHPSPLAFAVFRGAFARSYMH